MGLAIGLVRFVAETKNTKGHIMQKSTNLKVIATATLASLSLSSLAQAEIKGKDFSVNQVSPAQRYNLGTGTSGQLEFDSLTLGAENSSAEFKTQSSTARAVGQYQLPETFGGMEVSVGRANSEMKLLDETIKSESDDLGIKPFVGFNITPNVTVAYEANFQKTEFEDGPESEQTQHTVAAAYHTDKLEAGVAYSHQVDDDDGFAPRTILLHGQAMVNDQLTVGALLSHDQYSAIDGFDSDSDSTTVGVTSTFQIEDKWSVEGGLAYSADNEDVSAISTQIGTYLDVKENVRLGSQIAYSNGSSANDELNDVETDYLRFAINANYSF